MAKLLEIYLGKVTLHLIHRGEGMLALDEIDEELAINECFDTDECFSIEVKQCPRLKDMLLGAIERSLYFSLDKAEEDVLVGVIVWCNLLPLRKIDVHDH